jgi:hypothetical protein
MSRCWGGRWSCGASRSTSFEGRPEGGYTDLYELICCYCGDNPELDYRDVPADLQRIRGPYTVSAGISAYGRHVTLRHR